MIIFIQLAKWFWALFPALIGIMSPTGAYNKQNNLDLQASQLVVNSDLTLDSDNNDIPDGFVYFEATNISLTNGIAKFTPLGGAPSGRLSYGSGIVLPTGTAIYTFVKLKTTDTLVRFISENSSIGQAIVIADGQMNFNSFVGSMNNSNGLYLRFWSLKTSDWTPIEVDYMGAINLTAVFGNDIPDKQVLDDFILSGERFLFTDDATTDSWFNTGFTGESKDILDILGYFFWLAIPIICIYWVFRLLIELIT